MTEGKPNYDPEGINADIRQQLRDQSGKQAAVKEPAKYFKHYHEREWLPMYKQVEEFMSNCKLTEFTREKVLNVTTAFALEIARHEAPAVNQKLKEALICPTCKGAVNPCGHSKWNVTIDRVKDDDTGLSVATCWNCKQAERALSEEETKANG